LTLIPIILAVLGILLFCIFFMWIASERKKQQYLEYLILKGRHEDAVRFLEEDMSKDFKTFIRVKWWDFRRRPYMWVFVDGRWIPIPLDNVEGRNEE